MIHRSSHCRERTKGLWCCTTFLCPSFFPWIIGYIFWGGNLAYFDFKKNLIRRSSLGLRRFLMVFISHFFLQSSSYLDNTTCLTIDAEEITGARKPRINKGLIRLRCHNYRDNANSGPQSGMTSWIICLHERNRLFHFFFFLAPDLIFLSTPPPQSIAEFSVKNWLTSPRYMNIFLFSLKVKLPSS